MGPWDERETERLKLALKIEFNTDVSKEKELKMKTRIFWTRLLPYVRTRQPNMILYHYKHRILKSDITNSMHISKKIEMIDFIFNSDASAFTQIDWNSLSQKLDISETILKREFSIMYKKLPSQYHNDFERVIELLNSEVKKKLENLKEYSNNLKRVILNKTDDLDLEAEAAT